VSTLMPQAIFLSALILSSNAAAGTGEILGTNKTSSIDKALRSVLFLSVPDKDKASINHIGTGFLFNGNGQIFIVTAAHVATLMSSESNVTFGNDKGEATKVNIKEVINASEPKWLFHPTADVAVLQVDSNSRLLSDFTSRAILPINLRAELKAPIRTRPLTTIGFPLGLGVSISPGSKLSPISKESRAASDLLILSRFDTKSESEFFILDSPSVGGFSGSPVFVLPATYNDGNKTIFSGPAMYCVGLVHGTISDATGGKFAAVVPSAHIAQLIESALTLAIKN
jgi:hypothetical protein